MSARMFMIVLRVACDRVGVEDPWKFCADHADQFAAPDEDLGFHVALTTRKFIDYVLKCEVTEKEFYGETRALTKSEREEYEPVFRELFPDIEMEQVRYVEFAWYDSTEAPDYYMPCMTKKITVFDVQKLIEDEKTRELFNVLNEMLGKSGRFRFRLAGIPYENRIFVEAETEELCEKAIAEVEDFLKKNGYSEPKE
ncbi:MAG: hypothetical protein J5750_04240 [Clostridiales bacterium]|nr:hypothetical protein [Clostridiales bacterium]